MIVGTVTLDGQRVTLRREHGAETVLCYPHDLLAEKARDEALGMARRVWDLPRSAQVAGWRGKGLGAAVVFRIESPECRSCLVRPANAGCRGKCETCVPPTTSAELAWHDRVSVGVPS